MWFADGAYIEIIAFLSFCDPNLVSELLSDRVAINLMYIEAVADVDRGHWEVGRERRGESLPHCRRAKERSE